MLVLGNLLIAIAALLDGLLLFAWFLVLARVVLSWVNADPHNAIVRFIYASTDPLLLPLQRKFRLRYGAIDFSPIVLLLAISFLRIFLVQTIQDYAIQIKRQQFMSQELGRSTERSFAAQRAI